MLAIKTTGLKDQTTCLDDQQLGLVTNTSAATAAVTHTHTNPFPSAQ
jgi:hypothetical protein